MAINPEALTGTLAELKAAEQALSRLAASAGIRYRIINLNPTSNSALRTLADTTRYLGYRDADYAAYVRSLKPGAVPVPKETWRPIAPFGHSYHNFGAAFDVAPTTWPSGMGADAALTHVGQLAPRAGLRWGGGPDFPASRKDRPHFELPVPLSQAQRMYAGEYGQGALDAILAQAHNAVNAVKQGATTSGALVAVAVAGVLGLLFLIGKRKLSL